MNHAIGPTLALEKLLNDFQQARRIAFAEAIDLLPPEHTRFARTLNALRNKFAHRAENLGLTLDSYVATLDGAAQESFRTGLNALGPTLNKLAKDAPITMLLVSSIVVLVRIYDVKMLVVKRTTDLRERDKFDEFIRETVQTVTAAKNAGTQAD